MAETGFGLPREGAGSGDGVVDSASLSVSNGDLNLTLGRSDGLPDLTASTAISAFIPPAPTPTTQAPSDIFSSGQTISSSNFSDWQNRARIYFRNDDSDQTVFLPLESDIPANQYPFVTSVRMFGGQTDDTSNSGATLNNVLRFRVQVGDTTSIQRPDGTILTEATAFLGQVFTFIKQSAGSNFVLERTVTDPRTSLLPSGGVRLREPKASIDASSISGIGVSSSIVKGDAFEVVTGNSNVGGADGIKPGDIIIALQDSPSLLNSEIDANWFIMLDKTNFPLTLDEIRLLAQFSHSSRLESTGLLTNTRFWLLDAPPTQGEYPDLSEAQSDQYIATSEQISKRVLIAQPISNLHTSTLYRNINRSGVYEQVTQSDLFDDFSATLPDASGRRYYISKSVLNIHDGHELVLHSANNVTSYSSSAQVNTTSGIRGLEFNQLDPTTQARISQHTSLDGQSLAAIDGLRVSTESADIDSTTRYYLGYGESDLDTGSYSLTTDNTIRGTTFPQKVQILMPYQASLTSCRRKDQTSTTVQIDDLGTIYDSSLNRPLQHFQVILPSDTVAREWELTGTVSPSKLSGADDSFKVRDANIADALRPLIFNTDSSLSDAASHFVHDLTRDPVSTATTWSAVPGTKLIREASAFIDENRVRYTGNRFEDIANTDVTGFGNNSFWYNESDSSDPDVNSEMTGRQSFADGDNIRIRNGTGGVGLEDVIGKVFTVDYRLRRQITAGDGVQPVLRFGNAPIEPIIGIDATAGLHIRVGRGDGTTVTRTERESYTVDNPQWSVAVGNTPLSEESFINLPADFASGTTVTVAIQGFNNDNDAGTHTETYTVTDASIDQSFGARTYTFGANTLSVTASYDASYTSDGNTRPVLQLTASLTNASYHYNIAAYTDTTLTFTNPSTYSEQSINTGNPTDRFGAYSVQGFDTMKTDRISTITGMIVKQSANDMSSDPEVGLILIVNGQLLNSGNPYSVGRTKSQIDTSDFNGGSGLSGFMNVSNMQLYRYTVQPTAAELSQYDANRDAFLGQFRESSDATDSFNLSAKLRVQNNNDDTVRIGEVIADTVDPSAKPESVLAIWFNSVNSQMWISKGTNSTADWVRIA